MIGLAMTTGSLTLSTFDSPPDDMVRTVDEGLEAHNHSVAPLSEVRALATFAQSPDGTVRGGALGRTWGKCCELLELWVSPDQRGQGTGSALLKLFEQQARQRGCSVFYLTTLSFQAPDFYRRHGYQVTTEISGYPNGIRKFLMQRTEA